MRDFILPRGTLEGVFSDIEHYWVKEYLRARPLLFLYSIVLRADAKFDAIIFFKEHGEQAGERCSSDAAITWVKRVKYSEKSRREVARAR